MIIELGELKPGERQNWLQHAVAPRPIALASSVNSKGEVNLAPFSFFNLFSTTPPIVIFSPARRVRNNTTKHTLQNVEQVPEVVINIVDFNMVRQTSLASCEYPAGVNEFVKAGFTAEPATRVKPPLVKESKVKLECRVNEIKPLGTSGGAGNLVICEVICMHVAEEILNAEETMIDQQRLEHVARMGGNWYSHISAHSLFEVEKPNVQLGIGIDALPDAIRQSRVLTGNQLGQLGNVHEWPAIDPAFDDGRLREIIQYFSINPRELEQELHRYAAELLNRGRVQEAWQVLLTQY